MITAASINNKILVTITDKIDVAYKLFRREYNSDNWLIFDGSGFIEETPETVYKAINSGDFVDSYTKDTTLYAYCYCEETEERPIENNDRFFSNWVRNGGNTSIGYTFSNYKVPSGQWGTIVTPDDIRYTYLWGTDFKATNGESFSDDQIQFFIDSAMESIGRQLDITIKKKRVRSNATDRNLTKNIDFDVDEAPYDFKFEKISRYGVIATRLKPILKLHKLTMLSRLAGIRDLTNTTIVDKTKGLLKMMERPIRPTDSANGIMTATGIYGNQTLSAHLFYSIDYDAGYETSDDVPMDLREIIAKQAAVSLLNIVGDGLMSGFSSSSLSMDGMSESFSSTQSATSAYFGARIKVYQDDIKEYLQATKNKFGHMTIGSI